MSDETRGLRRWIHGQLQDFTRDELRVVSVVVERLTIGRERYGPLDLARQRDWKREKSEELVDMHVYEACAYLSKLDERTAAIEICLEEIADADPVVPPSFVDLLGDEEEQADR